MLNQRSPIVCDPCRPCPKSEANRLSPKASPFSAPVNHAIWRQDGSLDLARFGSRLVGAGLCPAVHHPMKQILYTNSDPSCRR
ncbi:MAG: hypothetical protein IPG76_20220 [Acidobacteria bacterium]|nr:hypothetical protein [Acidobacteriota bacterium]